MLKAIERYAEPQAGLLKDMETLIGDKHPAGPSLKLLSILDR